MSCLLGEALEGVTLACVRRANRIRRLPRLAGRIVTIGSVAWACGMVGGIAAFWAIGGLAFWFLSFVFLFSALVNAQLVGGLHLPSLRVKQVILAGTAVALTVDAYFAGATVQDVEAFAIGAMVMLLTLAGLFVRLGMQINRRHAAERRLIEAQLDLEQSNEALQISKERLKRNARKAEALAFDSQASNRAKSQFLATMSREIRAPMRDIIRATEYLEDGQGTPAAQIKSTATSLLALVGDILDLNLAEAGKLKIDRAGFALLPMWDDLIGWARTRATEKGLKLSIDGTVGEGVEVEGDEARIKQVLRHLLQNAVSTTGEGTVTFGLATKRVENELSLCFSVTDQGPGISRANQARLFYGLGDDSGASEGTLAAGRCRGRPVDRRQG